MRPFTYQRAIDVPSAVQALASAATNNLLIDAIAQPLAGGTTLIDLMKLDVMRPGIIVDINPLAGAWSAMTLEGEGLRLGALARMSDVAANPEIAQNYPVIADSLKLAASPQLRNMATLGGNVLQRTRCSYFRDVSYDACNKRHPGSGCAALEGFNRSHEVLGTSDQCIATYPGDFAQALRHEGAEISSRADPYAVGGTKTTTRLYACPNVESVVSIVRADRNTPGFMRSPPEVPYQAAAVQSPDAQRRPRRQGRPGKGIRCARRQRGRGIWRVETRRRANGFIPRDA